MPDATLQRRYRVRVATFLVGVLVCIILLNTLYKGINTFNCLKVVESERDRWQRPPDVIEALKLKEGNAVADVGSGAGYFALKLSRAVGSSGKVLAEDIRKLPLVFLWIRAFLGSQHNIRISVGDPDDPHLRSEERRVGKECRSRWSPYH